MNLPVAFQSALLLILAAPAASQVGHVVEVRLQGEELAGNIQIIGTRDVASDNHVVELGAGRRAVIYMWISLEPGAEPTSINHHLGFAQVSAEGDTTRHEVHTEPLGVAPDPVVISAPVRGDWYTFFGPANGSRHRRGFMSVAGRATIAARFATDWIRVVDGRYMVQGGSENSAHHAWGQEALAVADGNVVDIKDGIPNNVPGSEAVEITVETMGGNYVILDIGSGRYASYFHLQPGSLSVAVGDRVRVGDVIGLIGNSGNSGGPHLHFQITDGPSPFGAEGVPYLIDRFEVIGRLNPSGPPPLETFAPQLRELEMPLANTLVRFRRN
jgi:hypothetical protein